ncbi:hypothetical protein TNIN_75511 [Trichonephila inaurata madagascariensis]|uniref:Uncharacterized protein n=1 Tax=Trichonephila inaurata madagascariensis TaxID=2747483 RepID=A0A8X6WY81_9ARAC|nr:hypothetical protein TNIN_75511 [Trichonephila inaurata madagascariensis]
MGIVDPTGIGVEDITIYSPPHRARARLCSVSPFHLRLIIHSRNLDGSSPYSFARLGEGVAFEAHLEYHSGAAFQQFPPLCCLRC